jgi:ATP-dependent helicase HepA
LLERLADEFARDLRVGPAGGGEPEVFGRDPRILWLLELLRDPEVGKVLLICRRKAKVLAIEAALREHLSLPVALFHEDLELVQRDRNAAWFAEADGARILLASEIGSEGRNFQFAHHLVLFDLPLDPELVEQRIGRLDRIGQRSDIRIHVPYVVNSPQEVLFRWYHEGLDTFGHNLHAGRELLEAFGAEVRDLAMDFHETHLTRRVELDGLIERSRSTRHALERRLELGRDRLLELNSFRPEIAAGMVKEITVLDGEEVLEGFLLRVWDQFGVPVEDLGPRRYRIGADGVFADSFPGLPAEGLALTFDRAAALAREDIAFLTWDHPMVTGALDLLVGGARGGTACVAWVDAPEPGLWLEAIHVLECVASPRLHADRFLPPVPVRVWVDAGCREVPASARAGLDRGQLVDVALPELLDSSRVRALLAAQVAAAGRMAGVKAGPLMAEAGAAMERQLGGEVERLRALAAVNPNVRPEEIAGAEREMVALREALKHARLRLDALRVIVLGER